MPRKSREEEEGALHHVFAHAVGKELLFEDTPDRALYLGLLEGAVSEWRWQLLSYCLMGTHMHLLIETPIPNLGQGMQQLHGEFAVLVNASRRRRGHMFERRYGSTRIKSDEQLKWTVQYVVNNPVKAGLVERAEDWAWSSHAGVLEGRAPAWVDVAGLLGRFGANGGDPLAAYRALVTGPDAGPAAPPRPDFAPRASGRWRSCAP